MLLRAVSRCFQLQHTLLNQHQVLNLLPSSKQLLAAHQCACVQQGGDGGCELSEGAGRQRKLRAATKEVRSLVQSTVHASGAGMQGDCVSDAINAIFADHNHDRICYQGMWYVEQPQGNKASNNLSNETERVG